MKFEARKYTNPFSQQAFVVLSRLEVQNSALVFASQVTVWEYFLVHDLRPSEAPEFLATEYAQLAAANDNFEPQVKITDANGREVELDTSPLDPSDEIIDAGLGAKWLEAQRSFFRRKFFAPPQPYIIPYVHPKNIDVWLLTVNIVGARLPEISRFWPRNFAANDNAWKFSLPANDQ